MQPWRQDHSRQDNRPPNVYADQQGRANPYSSYQNSQTSSTPNYQSSQYQPKQTQQAPFVGRQAQTQQSGFQQPFSQPTQDHRGGGYASFTTPSASNTTSYVPPAHSYYAQPQQQQQQQSSLSQQVSQAGLAQPSAAQLQMLTRQLLQQQNPQQGTQYVQHPLRETPQTQLYQNQPAVSGGYTSQSTTARQPPYQQTQQHQSAVGLSSYSQSGYEQQQPPVYGGPGVGQRAPLLHPDSHMGGVGRSDIRSQPHTGPRGGTSSGGGGGYGGRSRDPPMSRNDRPSSPRGGRRPPLRDNFSRRIPSPVRRAPKRDRREEDRHPRRDDRLRKRRRSKSKSPKRDEVIKARQRSRSKENEQDLRRYEVKISSENYAQLERSCLDLKRRYPRLYLSPDFSKLICWWTQALPPTDKLDIYSPVKIVCETEKSTKKKKTSKSDSDSPTSDTQTNTNAAPVAVNNDVKYNSKIILMSGVANTSSSSHLSHLIKFLVAKRDRNELLCFGGGWSASKDGGDPATDDSALIRTAIRCVKEQAQLDLTPCKKWSKFMEIQYQRENGQKEVTVIFLPDTASLVPTMEDFMRVCRQRQAKQQAHQNKLAKKESKQAKLSAIKQKPMEIKQEEPQTQPDPSTQEPASDAQEQQDMEVDDSPKQEDTTQETTQDTTQETTTVSNHTEEKQFEEIKAENEVKKQTDVSPVTTEVTSPPAATASSSASPAAASTSAATTTASGPIGFPKKTVCICCNSF
eukprot:TRINITY_DN996_c0_g2_i1.p1 TRINITY_DN996_c0_g2~~TRINITY_DN996_c0_g2_i1.p1  ORF type:complete len:741 (-),score=193.47 TRINITY_DN996_c0_g2_i1:507-2729(-)